MQVIKPVTFNKNTMLVSTTATETVPAWSSTTTYNADAEVLYNDNIYVSLQGSNTNKKPDTNPTWWLIKQAGNKMAMFDDSVSEYMPLDVSNRLGMGNLIPGTSLLTKKEDYSRDMMEIGGPAADFVSRIFRGSRMVLEGDVGKGILEPMPLAIRNAFKGLEMGITVRVS